MRERPIESVLAGLKLLPDTAPEVTVWELQPLVLNQCHNPPHSQSAHEPGSSRFWLWSLEAGSASDPRVFLCVTAARLSFTVCKMDTTQSP